MTEARSNAWQDFNHSSGAVAQPSAQSDEFLAVNARLFNSADGRKWLEYMREEKFEKDVRVEISQSALVHLEGQRQFLRDIKRWLAQFSERSKLKQETK